jgi:D-galactarolactone isomerase
MNEPTTDITSFRTGPAIDRRALLTGAVALTATGAISPDDAQAQQVPNSVGTEPPKLKAPANACDCHMHTYDPARFPMPPNPRAAPSNATVVEYRLLQKRIGTSRVVIVQPRNYATDNRVTLYAVQQLAPARGVAVVHPSITDAELKAFNDGGIRGIRFSLGDPASRAVTPDMIEPLSHRIADLGWHIQFNVDGAQVIEFEAILRRLPTPIVFDHLAHPGERGIDDASHKIVRELIDRGRTWVKLSGAPRSARRPIPTRPRSHRPSSRPRPSGWCGAAIGRIRACPTTTSPTTRYCST